MTAAVQTGQCRKCGGFNKLLYPLHGERGGPLMCLTCGTDWHVEKRRRDKNHQLVTRVLGGGLIGDPIPELTSELLAEVLQLTHPDKHPPERKELAERVTAELTRLKPYTFPKPKPDKAGPIIPPKRLTKEQQAETDEKARQAEENRYPCRTCSSEIPKYYCDRCRARWEEELEQQRENERQQARARRERRRMAKQTRCHQCHQWMVGKRKDTKYCSPACRQKAHRVTAKRLLTSEQTESCNHAVSQIETRAPTDPVSICNAKGQP